MPELKKSKEFSALIIEWPTLEAIRHRHLTLPFRANLDTGEGKPLRGSTPSFQSTDHAVTEHQTLQITLKNYGINKFPCIVLKLTSPILEPVGSTVKRDHSKIVPSSDTVKLTENKANRKMQRVKHNQA